MKNIILKTVSLLLPAAMLLNGCTPGNGSQTEADVFRKTVISKTNLNGLPFEFQTEPETFNLSFQVDGETVPVSAGTEARTVADYKEEGTSIFWRYPDEQISVALTPADDYLSVEITSSKDGDNSFVWPNVSAGTYYIPFGEGKRIPANDEVWKEYLGGQEFTVLEQLSMPFWISSDGKHSVLFIMETPHRTHMNFSAKSDISFHVSHEYPEIDKQKTNRFRIYITDSNPVNAAKLYRDYAIETGNLVTLEEKAGDNPNIRKLYGAPFVYLGGNLFAVSPEDIDWTAFRKALTGPVMDHLMSLSGSIENGQEFLNAVNEIKTQDYVAAYQKNIICSYLSQVLKLDNFWNPSIFKERSSDLNHMLEKGYENLKPSEKMQIHKYALALSLPEVFSDAGHWADSSTVDILNSMKESGIDHAWVSLHGWEDAYMKPELIETADKLGYLIASYDSYHSIHEPGKERWLTAKFDDTSLYENASVTDKNGEKVRGFQNVGRKLNPVLSLPAVRKRMEDIMANRLPFNSWFIDCDATGEIYDDYTESHITTQQEDLEARLGRMAYIRDQYSLVIGSEGGNDYAAPTIAFSHGIELPSFSWMDDDMKRNRDSEYYVGNFYNPNGGVTLNFSKRIPLKEKYYELFVNPQYDIPLFKLVYNDSVITSYHWDWSTFKIQGATQNRMVREVLYNVSPLYHLDAPEWEKYRSDITNHQSVWSEFSRRAVTEEMTDFKYLLDDGSVQLTRYGETVAAVANFGISAFQYNQTEIPAHSVLIQTDGRQTVYTPSVSEGNQ